MSASTDHLAIMNPPVERRFYPRVTPPAPIYVAFGPNNLGTLLNVSENGLLVSTPSALELNSAYRVFLSLSGAPSTVNVSVRTVWTEESQKCSGIQLLDLAEQDREQIRKWVAAQVPQNEDLTGNVQRWFSPAIPEAPPQILEPAPQVDETPKKTEYPPMPLPIHGEFTYEPPANSRTKRRGFFRSAFRHRSRDVAARPSSSRSSARVFILWTALMLTICVAAAWPFRYELSQKFLRRPALSAPPQRVTENAPAVDPEPSTSAAAPDSPVTPAPADIPTGRDSQPSEAQTNESQTNNNSGPDSLSPAPVTSREIRRSNNVPSQRLVLNEPAPRPNLYASPKHSAEMEQPEAPRSYAAESTLDRTSAITASPAPTTRPAEIDAPAMTSSTTPAVYAAPPAVTTTTAPPPAPAKLPTSSPAANSPSSNTNTYSAKTTPPDAPSRRSAITGSIYSSSPQSSDLTTSRPAGNAVMQTPSPVFPSSANARGNSSVARNPAPSSPAPSNALIQMDAPAPSVVELSAPRSLTASYLPLPGEQVFRSPSVTMHIQRSVWVHGDRWIWRTHKKVALGELATRVDPQIPQLPAAAGSITVQANIDKEGYISGIKPLYGSFALLPNVSRAIRDWRYQPTYVDNKPADTQAKIEIDFHPTNARASRP